MGKPKAERRLPENEVQAVARNLRVSPQKLNLVAAMIRGKKVGWPVKIGVSTLRVGRKPL